MTPEKGFGNSPFLTKRRPDRAGGRVGPSYLTGWKLGDPGLETLHQFSFSTGKFKFLTEEFDKAHQHF